MKNNFYQKFVDIKKYTDHNGAVYGTEDFAIYLYSIIKMQKPKHIVELGTGLGITMLWSALALEENGHGKIVTIDDGSEWERISSALEIKEHYSQYINDLITQFDFKNISFLNHPIEVFDNSDPIDILFCDYAHSSFDICKLLSQYLPKMNEYSKIYIDSASTHYNSYNTLNSIIDILNQGHIPKTLQDLSKVNLKKYVEDKKFSIEHIIENKDRNQNSTACVTISPIDIFPYPRVNIRAV